MNMKFNYSHTETFEESIELEDAPNCCLKAYKDTQFGEAVWYIIMNTELGYTRAEWFGPFDLQDNIDSGKFYYNYNYFECKDKIIQGTIDRFLNKTGGDSFQVEEVNKKDVYKILDSAQSQLKELRG